MKLGTASAAVLGACDGELTLGEIVSAVGHLLEAEITHEVLPEVRQALADGIVKPLAW